jgi:predicted ATPase/DNA-binding SARP family transcriptional activator/tetratricopeptide (TPR) repeat protein
VTVSSGCSTSSRSPEGPTGPSIASVPELRLTVLGPLSISVDGAAVPLGERARALIAALTCRPDHRARTDELVEVLWRDEPPTDARNALQALVSRVRRQLGDAATVLVTSTDGYALVLPPEVLDADRLETAVRRARAPGGRPLAEVAADLTAALASWRGEPYAEYADDPAAVVAASRLAEVRLEALELRAEAVLAEGGGPALVAELTAAVEEEPTRERLHRALALALYRAGRQTDALTTLAGLVGRLRDGFGLDPEPATTRLQAALLSHDERLTGAPLESPQPASAAVSTPPSGRPHAPAAARSSFVGRSRELEDLRAALAADRVVTLLGPGGTGKTRLALEAVRELHPPPGDGVAFVELASITDADDVVGQVAWAVGVDPEPAGGVGATRTPGTSALDRLRDHVAGRELLVLLDNCEHLLDATAAVVEHLLDAGTRVRVVATSREALRVPGEVLLPVPPLALPSDDHGSPEQLLGSDAVRLFVDRATASDPAFRLDATTATAVAAVCRRLDGLPLAIELAAARTATLPVATLVERLDDRFRLLTGGRRTVRRQQTLEAVVRWSYDLLDPAQRCVLRRLGVFAGPVPVPVVERVVADVDPRDGQVATSDVLPLLLELAERSLVSLDDAGEDLGVRTLETIRAFALQRLLDEDDADALRERHAAAFASRAAIAAVALRGPSQLIWLDRLDREVDDYRGALAWSLDRDPGRAVAMAADLAWYWWLHDQRAEGIRWLERALHTGAAAATPVGAAFAWGWLAFLRAFDNRGGVDEAVQAARDSYATLEDEAPGVVVVGVPLLLGYAEVVAGGDATRVLPQLEQLAIRAEAIGEDWVAAASHFVVAGLAHAAGQRDVVVPAAEHALAAARRAGERWAEFQTLQLLAEVRARAGAYATAAEHLARAIPLGDAVGSRERVREMWVQRAMLDMLAGDLDTARARLAELLVEPPAHARDLAHSMAWNGLGMVLRRQQDPDGAADAHARAVAGFEAAGDPQGVAEACVGLALAEVQRGQVAAARAAMATAVGSAGADGVPFLGATVPLLHEGAAAVAEAMGDPELALHHLGRAAALREGLGSALVGGERFDVDRVEAAARTALTPDVADGALSAGAGRVGLLLPVD